MTLLTLVILGLLIGLFIIIQAKTLFFEHHYVITTGWLFLTTVTALVMTVLAIANLATDFYRILAMMGIIVTVLLGALVVAKVALRDNWSEAPRRLLRVHTTLDFPHDRLTVQTSDGVDIRGYHIHPEKQLRKSVVILAHGAFRSKDLFVKALLTAWLSETFDVISFDFRGHGESGGVWTGDGKTIADLKCVIDFARQKGYQKIGVYGRSMGGWTAILEAVDYHDVDALVVAGLPPGFFSEVPEFEGRIKIIKYPGAAFLTRILLGVRFKHFTDARRPIDEIGRVSPIPLLLLFNKVDPAAGVEWERGMWDSIPPRQRRRTIRNKRFIFSAEEVFNKASQPKKLLLLPGIGHVYSLQGLRTLFTQVEEWFKQYLD
jgi:pimeloyl-ACP methyl ester carboxylesterase